jgi:hypothetical protein
MSTDFLPGWQRESIESGSTVSGSGIPQCSEAERGYAAKAQIGRGETNYGDRPDKQKMSLSAGQRGEVQRLRWGRIRQGWLLLGLMNWSVGDPPLTAGLGDDPTARRCQCRRYSGRWCCWISAKVSSRVCWAVITGDAGCLALTRTT